jgi:hypothetical protein
MDPFPDCFEVIGFDLTYSQAHQSINRLLLLSVTSLPDNKLNLYKYCVIYIVEMIKLRQKRQTVFPCSLK